MRVGVGCSQRLGWAGAWATHNMTAEFQNAATCGERFKKKPSWTEMPSTCVEKVDKGHHGQKYLVPAGKGAGKAIMDRNAPCMPSGLLPVCCCARPSTVALWLCG